MIADLDKRSTDKSAVVRESGLPSEEALHESLAATLPEEVAAMNVDNFVVRPKRKLVERFAKPEAWRKLGRNQLIELSEEIAGLPSELDPEDEEAKRTDLLILTTQLALLRAEPVFKKLDEQVRTIASLLEENSRIPAIQQRFALIQEIQTDEWWQDVTLGLLENARKGLRDLVKLIEKKRRKPVYSDFEDVMGAEVTVDLPGVATSGLSENFRVKARQFLREHENHIAINKRADERTAHRN